MSSPNQRYCLPCSHALRGVKRDWRGEVMKKLGRSIMKKEGSGHEPERG